MNFIQSPNYTKGRAKKITGIVLHTIVGSASSAIGHFKNPASQVSAHYVIAMDGTVTQMVRDEDTAYHAGRVSGNTTIFTGNPNDSTIGIEHDDGGDPGGAQRSDALYSASAALVRDLCKKHGIPFDRTHIVGHREVYNKKSCPGNLDIDRIIRMAQGSQGDDVTKEQAVDAIYIATRGRPADGAERAFALGGISITDLAELRHRDDVIAAAWMASEGTYCPQSEKDYWLRAQKEHGGHPVETFARTWYNDHVVPKLNDLTEQRDASRINADNLQERLDNSLLESARLEALLNEKTAAYDQLGRESAVVNAELAKSQEKASLAQSQLEQCQLERPQTMNGVQMIIEGIRRVLGIK